MRGLYASGCQLRPPAIAGQNSASKPTRGTAAGSYDGRPVTGSIDVNAV